MSSAASSLIAPLHSPVTFEPVGLVTNVFFDDRNCQVRANAILSENFLLLIRSYHASSFDCTYYEMLNCLKMILNECVMGFLMIQQVFSVRSGGATGIISRGFVDEHNSTFRLADQGPICTIKLSPDQKVLAVQRNKTDVQFIGVNQLGSNGIFDSR